MENPYNEPFTLQNEDGTYPVIFTVEHAENVIPKYLNNLGLEDTDLTLHIAYDIGIKKVCKIVSDTLDIPTIYGGYSRLVCEINRHIDSGILFLDVSDGITIPGNINLSDDEKNLRIEKVFKPYHKAASELIDRIANKHAPKKPIVFTMHSFTPIMQTEGKTRPWHISLSTYSSDELMQNIAADLTANGLVVGINEPYNLRDYPGVSLDTNAHQKGLPNILVEIRQDLISTSEGVEKFAKIITEVIKKQII